MSVGLLVLHLFLPGCISLKEKRGRIKPILARLHNTFNVSAAEIERMDAWQEAVLAITVVSNERVHVEQVLNEVISYIEKHWPDENILDQRIEFL
jgi:uncharacterized protein YlxP (DUF503 family)